jgi:hypothetical protein
MLRQVIPHFIVGLLVLGALLFLLSLQQLRRGRTGPYWRLRRAAGQRGGQLFLISMSLFGLALALAIFSGMASLALANARRMLGEQQPTEVMAAEVTEIDPAATDAPAFTPTPTETPTLEPSLTSTSTPTATVTASETPTPTITPTPTATYETAFNLRAFPDARPANRDAVVKVIAADTQLSANNTPVNPMTKFSAGVKRIYLFFSYRGMASGVAWSRVLYRNGAALQGSSLLWSLDAEGSSYFFFGSDEGYTAGQYRVEIRLGDTVVSQFDFVVE